MLTVEGLLARTAQTDADLRRAEAALTETIRLFDAIAERALRAEQSANASERRANELADEVASLKEQLARANHALSLTGRTQSAARA